MPGRGTAEQDSAAGACSGLCRCIVSLQIAHVQVPAKLLDVSGMELEWNRRLQTNDSSAFDSALGICMQHAALLLGARGDCHGSDGLSNNFNFF